jgi:NADH-quinone oxidoreductase subunit J
MLLDPFSAAVLRDKKKPLSYLAVLLAILVLMALYPILRSFDPAQTPRMVDSMSGDAASVKHLGQVLFNQFLVPFEVTSVLILVAIIGVVVLARRQS